MGLYVEIVIHLSIVAGSIIHIISTDLLTRPKILIAFFFLLVVELCNEAISVLTTLVSTLILTLILIFIQNGMTSDIV